MSGHTPGPWDTNIVGRHIYIEASLRPYVHQEVAACGPTEHVDQQKANARLIAAAPIYYEAGVEFHAYEGAIAAGDDMAAMQHYARASQLLAEAHAKATQP